MHAVQADRRGRLGLILDRDGPTCVWRGRRFEGFRRPTTEHLARGGQRRARPWLAAQLRRLRR